jgi:hypothetical protein
LRGKVNIIITCNFHLLNGKFMIPTIVFLKYLPATDDMKKILKEIMHYMKKTKDSGEGINTAILNLFSINRLKIPVRE